MLLELEKREDGMVVMSKGRLTKESDWSEPVHVKCDEGCEASVDELRNEACETISAKNFPVESANLAWCQDDVAVGENLYKEVYFHIKPKEGGLK